MTWIIIKNLIFLYIIRVHMVFALDTFDRFHCAERYQFENCTTEIPLFVNIATDCTEINSPILYEDIDFCKVDDVKSTPVNGLFTQSDDINYEDSLPLPFDIKFLRPYECKAICTKTYIGGSEDDERKLQTIKNAIHSKYQHNWFSSENIPVQWCTNKKGQRCYTEFPMGCYFDKKYINSKYCDLMDSPPETTGYYLYNHLNFKISFKTEENNFTTNDIYHLYYQGKLRKGIINSIKIFPESIHQKDPNKLNCNLDDPVYLSDGNSPKGESLRITYTYSVDYEIDNSIPPESNEADLNETAADRKVLENCKNQVIYYKVNSSIFAFGNGNKFECSYSIIFILIVLNFWNGDFWI